MRIFTSFASLAIAISLAAGLGACSAPSESTATSQNEDLSSGKVLRAVQMNDVSVLLPLEGKSQADIDANYLAMSSTAAGSSAPLVSSDVFDVANGGTAGMQGAPTYDAMRLVAFRFDPCFAELGPVTKSTTCENMIRLVFQNVTYNTATKSAYAADGAFHVFFSLTRTELVAALNEMTALRQANTSDDDLGPLAVHPIVAQQGITGAMAQGLNAIVLKYAQPKNAIRVTSFHGIFSQGTSWLFDIANISKSGKATLQDVATMTPAGTVESLRLGTAPTGLLSLSMAESTSKDGNHLLLDPVAQQNATTQDLQDAYDAALRVENPGFNSPNTIDCATCHTAQISRQLIGEQFFKMSPVGDPNLFVPDPSIPVADLALTIPVAQPTGLSLNLHAFSYDGAAPAIISRVVNESAANVALINNTLLAAASANDDSSSDDSSSDDSSN